MDILGCFDGWGELCPQSSPALMCRIKTLRSSGFIPVFYNQNNWSPWVTRICHDWVHIRPGLAPNVVTSLIEYAALSCYWPNWNLQTQLKCLFIYFLFWWGRQWKHDTKIRGHKFKTLSLSWGESACGRKSEQEETKLIGYEEAKWGYPQYLASNLAFEWCSHCGQQWEGTMNSGDGNVGAKRLIFLGWPELRNSLRAWQVAASQTVDWHVSKSLLLSIDVFSLALLMSSVKGQQWDSQAEFL